MIQVTLNFPDQAALVAFFTGASSAPLPATEAETVAEALAPAAEKPARAPKPPKAEKPATETQPSPSAAPAAEPSTVSSPAAAPAASDVDYPTLQKAVFGLAGLSREAAGACAASLGVKTFKELPAERWAEALAAVKKATDELTAEAVA